MFDIDMKVVWAAGGYVVLIGLGWVLYQRHRSRQQRPGVAQTRAPKAAQPEGRKEDRKKRQRMESYASVASQNPPKSTSANAEAQPSAWLSNNAQEDDGAANREFAKQLAKAKEGTKFANKSEGRKQREKSVKQSRANQMAGSAENKATEPKATDEKPSAPSSSTGADADDDQSPVASPESAPADASGVADMLEPTRSGPSILRLTDTAPKKQQKPKAAKTPEPAETKKQRQNRKKTEAAKAARQEAEKDRKVLEEKQRRQARIAEGRAAKDGSQFMASNGNKSAWTQGAPNGSTNTSDKISSVPAEDVFHAPLDTFEETAEKPAVTTTKKQKPAASQSEDAWMSSLPSEEDQMEMLKDDTDEWNTVTTKASKKTSKKNSSDNEDQPAQFQPVRTKQSAPISTKGGFKPPATQSFGSFSALTSKDEPADDAEEEWEV